MLLRVAAVLLVAMSVAACIPPPVKPGVKTNIEKTTVTVKDPQGNVLRIEEKEMVLQEYTASEPVELKTVKPPKVQDEGDNK